MTTASMARQAVMEGQATWLTWAYVASRNGGKAELSARHDRAADRNTRRRKQRFSGVCESAAVPARIAGVSLQRRLEVSGRCISQGGPQRFRSGVQSLPVDFATDSAPRSIFSKISNPPSPSQPRAKLCLARMPNNFAIWAKDPLASSIFPCCCASSFRRKKAPKPPAIGAEASSGCTNKSTTSMRC